MDVCLKRLTPSLRSSLEPETVWKLLDRASLSLYTLNVPAGLVPVNLFPCVGVRTERTHLLRNGRQCIRGCGWQRRHGEQIAARRCL
ncbi:hypothetical protein HYQ46_008135 [Verticillium longisporum]|nr:hypothetical protein HYQ46_008135 [Verticillium longisporum]